MASKYPEPPDALVRQFVSQHPEGATLREISTALGEPLEAVDYAIRCALKKLAKSLNRHAFI